jgi:hypothetical protein
MSDCELILNFGTLDNYDENEDHSSKIIKEE